MLKVKLKKSIEKYPYKKGDIVIVEKIVEPNLPKSFLEKYGEYKIVDKEINRSPFLREKDFEIIGD